MGTNIRICGIYNEESFLLARENEIKNITFDFRPRSFNFVPLHVCESLISDFNIEIVRLLFSDDSLFVINEIIKKLNNLGVEISIEIDCARDEDFYQELNFPFCNSVTSFNQVEKLLKHSNLKSLIFNNDFINELIISNEIQSYINNIRNLLTKYDRNDVGLELKVLGDSALNNDDNLNSVWQSIILQLLPGIKERNRVINKEQFDLRLKDIVSI